MADTIDGTLCCGGNCAGAVAALFFKAEAARADNLEHALVEAGRPGFAGERSFSTVTTKYSSFTADADVAGHFDWPCRSGLVVDDRTGTQIRVVN